MTPADFTITTGDIAASLLHRTIPLDLNVTMIIM